VDGDWDIAKKAEKADIYNCQEIPIAFLGQ
jgi:hypothetical protein